VEGALPAIAPVSGAAADVLRRVLSADQSGTGIERATGPAEEYASISEAAKVFGVTTQSIRNWIDKGLLAAYVTPAGTRRVRREGLERVAAFRARPRPPGPTYSDAEIAEIIEHMRDE
jgi:excisionase family DNA binding protein